MLKHHNRLAATWILMLSVAFTTKAPAQEIYKTHCNWEKPEVTEQRSRLAPWFASFDAKLAKQTQYANVVNAMQQKLDEEECVTGFLTLKKNGAVKTLTVHSPSSPELKKAVTALILTASPLIRPPDEILAPSTRILIKFQKIHGSMTLISHLYGPLSVNARIGHQSDSVQN